MKSVTSGHPWGVPWCHLTEVFAVFRLVLLTMGRKLRTRWQSVYDENVVTSSCNIKLMRSFFVSCIDSVNSVLFVKASSFVSWSHSLLTHPFETFDKLTLFERFDNGTPNMVDMKTHDVIPSNITSPHRENNSYHGYNPLPLSVLHNVHNGPPPILERGKFKYAPFE